MIEISNTARYSNAGDSFHFRWTARRCLGLIDPRSKLFCITVEGASCVISPNNKPRTRGETVDVAEYYGDGNIKHATRVSYYQLKHSYVVGRPWTWSSLKTTLSGFFENFCIWKQTAEFSSTKLIQFTFVSNRPVSSRVRDLISKIRGNTLELKDEQIFEKVKEYLNTDDDGLAREFFSYFHIEDTNDLHWRQRSLLIEELNSYMAGSDEDVADQLWRLVCDKASP